MNTEKFFRSPGGKITFNAIESIGISNAVDCAKTHQRVARHFYAGDGWPAGKPEEVNHVDVWSAFKGMGALH